MVAAIPACPRSVNPARAGMIRGPAHTRYKACCKPRTRGDDPIALANYPIFDE